MVRRKQQKGLFFSSDLWYNYNVIKTDCLKIEKAICFTRGYDYDGNAKGVVGIRFFVRADPDGKIASDVLDE